MAKVSFRTNVLLKSIIGKDLITDDNIAVLELVKNSFDAGSKESNIIFRNLLHNQEIKEYKKLNSSEIIISDRGSGMSEYDLINKWLNIAYSEKKAKKEEHNRTLAGNKGVGRFSCDRLGKFLTIYTKKSDSNLIKLSIDWREFEQIDDIEINIQDIGFELEEISMNQYQDETNLNSFKSGTTLSIKSLREEWNHKKILSLKRQLEKFINPNQSFESEKFDVNILAEEFLKFEKEFQSFQKINGTVENKIFDKLNFKVTYIHSEISEDGKKITTTLKDRGNEIFTLTEHNPFDLLKNIKIHIYYLNPYSKAYFMKQTGIRSNEFGSISFFIDGFRVPPYGDSGNDWLGMENRKNQGRARHLGTREVIGRIEVFDNVETDDDEKYFKIISSRSGVLNNDIFNQLTKFSSPFGYYLKTLRRLERFVVEGINWDSIVEKNYSKLEDEIINDPNWNESKELFNEDSLTRNKRILSVIEKIINAKKDEVIDLSINSDFVSDLADEQKEKSEAELNSIANELSKKELSSIELNQLLSKISTTKVELDNFPISQTEINKLKSEQKSLETQIQQQFKDVKALEEEKQKATENAERLEKELELEKEKNTYLRTSSRNLTEDAKGLVHNIKITSKKISDSVDNVYHKVLDEKYTKTYLLKSLGAIKFQAEKANKISKIITRSNFKADANTQIADVVKYINQYVNIYSDIYPKTELNFEVISNKSELIKKFSLLDISVVLDDLISNSVKASAKNIKIEMSNPTKEILKIYFSDDGSGVPEKFIENKETIFDLGITTTIGGSGIGLNSVRTGLKSMKGKINFIGNNVQLKGACFEITIQ
ncbi:Signal transduction histidine kinase [Polaribacter sp. Hel1_33_78]|uniref:ATP-binding protein n=1 Tax=Polaribacter sp. Hel1_33_78 TaxID=1336804 RepID=UPI00087B42FC|nr:ATP-binding protein [Polaribacter sp. Hel1_33_78]SDU11854.1 Signal transduction histidine kinase [Polaribacter sp. Hel1_33_78]